MRWFATKDKSSVTVFIALLCFGVLLSFADTSLLRADTIYLKDGGTIDCIILKEDKGWITFSHYRKGQERETDLPMAVIERVEKTDKEALHNTLEFGPIENVYQLGPILENSLPKKTSDEIVMIHLRGAFGVPVLSEIGHNITSPEVRLLLGIATKRSPKAIVLNIDSPGGLLSTCDSIINTLIEVQSDPHNETIVAWVEEGASAAALASLACKKIVMRPNGRMGSATAIYTDGEAVPNAKNALENKVESWSDARRRQISDLTGRPIEIQLAMQEPEHEFWFHESRGFSLSKPKSDSVSGWNSFDTSKSKPLALNATELEMLGVSDGTAGSIQSLLKILDLEPVLSVVHLDLLDQGIQEWVKSSRKVLNERDKDYFGELERVNERFNNFFNKCDTALTAVGLVTDNYHLSEVFRVKTAVHKIRVPDLTSKLVRMMKERDPERLELYRHGIQWANHYLDAANERVETSLEMRRFPTGEIYSDINKAWGYALQGPINKTYNVLTDKHEY